MENPSNGLDLATVFESYGMTAGMEAMEVQAILQLDGIPAVIVSTIMYPSLPYQVRVPKPRPPAHLTPGKPRWGQSLMR
jgi:hypothetical protein